VSFCRIIVKYFNLYDWIANFNFSIMEDFFRIRFLSLVFFPISKITDRNPGPIGAFFTLLSVDKPPFIVFIVNSALPSWYCASCDNYVAIHASANLELSLFLFVSNALPPVNIYVVSLNINVSRIHDFYFNKRSAKAIVALQGLVHADDVRHNRLKLNCIETMQFNIVLVFNS